MMKSTQTEREKLLEGRALWYEYVNLNGYSWEPNRNGISKLAKRLDLRGSYIQERINLYLEA